MDIGDTLQRARIRKSRTLEDLARATKIPLSALAAIEENKFDRLPAAIYTRSFLRQYAREVDLDPEEIVEHYLQEYAPSSKALTRDDDLAIEQSDAALATPGVRTIVIPRPPSGPALGATILVIGFIVYVIVGARTGNNDEIVPSQLQATADTSAATAPAPESDVTRAANITPEALRIELRVSGPCWVSATADRTPALTRLLKAGDEHVLEAREELVLRVGDPATLSMTINGVPARQLGMPGQPVTVQITKQNFRELLAS
jgi:cytoskeletal protein RodZ